MADSQKLQKMTEQDFSKLNPAQQIYVKRLERSAKAQADSHILLRRNKRITSTCLVASVLGIYFYTMWSVRQERLDDEFDKRPADLQTNEK